MKKIHFMLLGSLLCIVVLFSSCKKWDPWEEGGGGGGGEPVDQCTISGNLVRVPCGISDLDNFWIKTDNGKYYQPCDASLIHRMDLAYPLTEGMRVQFGYSVLSGKSVCDNEYLMLCPQKAPQRLRIKLTCFQPVMRCGTGLPDKEL